MEKSFAKDVLNKRKSILRLNQVKPLEFNEKTGELLFEYGYGRYKGILKNGLIFKIKNSWNFAFLSP